MKKTFLLGCLIMVTNCFTNAQDIKARSISKNEFGAKINSLNVSINENDLKKINIKYSEIENILRTELQKVETKTKESQNTKDNIKIEYYQKVGKRQNELFATILNAKKNIQVDKRKLINCLYEFDMAMTDN